jgi:hypothetical protein
MNQSVEKRIAADVLLLISAWGVQARQGHRAGGDEPTLLMACSVLARSRNLAETRSYYSRNCRT